MIGASLLDRLGLHRKELRAWAMYDWANSAMVTTIVTAVLPDLLLRRGGGRSGPGRGDLPAGRFHDDRPHDHRGALADPRRHRRSRGESRSGCSRCSCSSASAAVGLMFFIERGDWLLASVLFIVANIAVNGSFVFYDAFLPHIAQARRDRPGLDGRIRAGLCRRRACCWRSTSPGSRSPSGSGCLLGPA